MLNIYASLLILVVVTHKARTHSWNVRAHYHAGWCLWPTALCMALRGARPVECEREAQERAMLLDTCQRSHTTSLRTSNIHIHSYARYIVTHNAQ